MQPVMMPGQPPTGHASRHRDYRRTYKACNACRQKKVRCIPDPSGFLSGPCARCRRESRQCLFGADHSARAKKLTDIIQNRHLAHLDEHPTSVSDDSISTSRESRRHNSPTNHGETPSTVTGVSSSHRTPANRGVVNLNSPALRSSVLLTEVSCDNDALDVLFQSAETQPRHDTHSSTAQPTCESRQRWSRDVVLDIWNKCPIVRRGWVSAQEALNYVDCFFQNLAPLSPVLNDRYADHNSHHDLAINQPLLCCVILMISSRYHNLGGSGGVSRGTLVHEKLWEQCMALIQQLMFGQVHRQCDGNLSNGNILGLLLLVEWKPRAVHFSLPSNEDNFNISDSRGGWDFAPGESSGGQPGRISPGVAGAGRVSDHISWMVLSCALGLAHRSHPVANASRQGSPMPTDTLEGLRLRKLLYILIEQLSLRLGCEPMATTSLRSAFLASTNSVHDSNHKAVDAWLELTHLTRLVSDIFLSNPSEIKQIFLSDRSTRVFYRLRDQLAKWKHTYADSEDLKYCNPESFEIEYQYTRTLLNSVGMRAIASRVFAQRHDGVPPPAQDKFTLTATDHETVQEVIDGSRHILQVVHKLDRGGSLKFIPVRIVLRTVTASIFLLKALSLEPWNPDPETSLDVLTRAIAALHRISVDDMHLGPRYAALLEVHLSRFRSTFQSADRRKSSAAVDDGDNGLDEAEGNQNLFEGQTMGYHDWLSLLWEPSSDPFELAGNTWHQLGVMGDLDSAV